MAIFTVGFDLQGVMDGNGTSVLNPTVCVLFPTKGYTGVDVDHAPAALETSAGVLVVNERA